jgi:hypothetical protein
VREFLYVCGKIRIMRGIWWFFKSFPLPLCHNVIDTDGHVCAYIACNIISRCMWKEIVCWQLRPVILHGRIICCLSTYLFRMMGLPRPCLFSSPVLTIRNATFIM